MRVSEANVALRDEGSSEKQLFEGNRSTSSNSSNGPNLPLPQRRRVSQEPKGDQQFANQERIPNPARNWLRRSFTPLTLILLVVIGLSDTAKADAATDWNVIATNNARADGLNAITQSRVFAMTHAAIHDALNTVLSG